MAYKGRFTPRNPQKYRGDPSNIIYRSLWEMRLMKYLDTHSRVLSWSSEEVIVPYISPLDNRPHRYFVDFVVTIQREDGTVDTLMVEVKPKAQTRPPERPRTGRPTRRFVREVETWAVNSAKWEAARAFCAKRGWTFTIMTEDHLGK
jgi:hypothetical protein